MVTSAVVLRSMLALTPYVGDAHESDADRAELYRPVAEAIASAARTSEEAAWLVAQAYSETRLARYVLESRCSDGPVGARCDEGRSRGPWQLRAWCRATDVAGEARCAIRLARYGRQRCTNGWLGAFAVTRGLGQCTWSQAATRVRVMRRALEEMRTERTREEVASAR